MPIKNLRSNRATTTRGSIGRGRNYPKYTTITITLFAGETVIQQPPQGITSYRRYIEERIKDTKTGQALRHLPSGDINANRTWMTAAMLAVNLTAWCCDLSPAAAASGTAPERTPLRRHAHTLRRILFNVPARIIRTGRRMILRLPSGYPHADTFQTTLDAIYALPPP